MNLTIAFDSVLVEGVSLITATGETSDTVLAPTVLAHVEKVGTFVDILSIDVTVTFGTEFFESDGARFGTRIARVTPRFTDAATADALEIVTLKFLGADTVTVFEVARLLALIDAPCGRVIERQSRWASAAERSFRVDANATAFTDARIEVAFIDVGARLAVHFGVADGTIAFDRVAHLARTAPRETDRTAALGFQCQTRQVVLAAAVHHFRPARALSVICEFQFSP